MSSRIRILICIFRTQTISHYSMLL
uniref:Uncharacterized protein n=1 Tax=Romanomermis culicivorax TaxID=13658 RepID=A0A915JSQ3_ROMCU